MRTLPLLMLSPLLAGLAACASSGGNAPAGGDTDSLAPPTSATSTAEPPSSPASTRVIDDNGLLPSSTSASSGTCSYPKSAQPAAKDVGTPSTTDLLAPATLTLSLSYTQAGASVVKDVAIDLASKTAPCTVNSLAYLAGKHYFDGTVCHRLTTADSGIEVLQCGDPSGTGSGGPGYSFADELSGSETYGAGTVAMANAGPNTNGSQFFLVYGDSPLPPSYTVIGHMRAAGTDVVKAIAAEGTDTPGDGHPVADVSIKAASTA